MSSCVTMTATVCEVTRSSLLVCDCGTCQDVLVHYNNARCFNSGDKICIQFNGIMTASIPPQITATCIERISSCCR